MNIINKNDYVSPKEASKILGVHWQTLRNWDNNGLIETIRSMGGKRFYNVKKYIEIHGIKQKDKNKRNICYCRVSSVNQKSDLDNQIEYMKHKYPNNEIISDIASGLNFNRSGLNKIIKYALNGEINELIVAYKDRLARFGFDLINTIIK